jgi:peptide/nickel transport system permease protein
MLRDALLRLCWMPFTLLGIALSTFLLFDLVPLDRAALEVRDGTAVHSEARAEALRALRARYGQVDPATGAPRPVLERFGAWLDRASRLDLAPPGEDPARFRARFGQALAVSALLGLLALGLALAVGIPLGAWLGARAGRRPDRWLSAPLLTLSALPEFLVATLLLLFAGGGLGPALLPAVGLRSPGLGAAGLGAGLLDLAAHLALPVLTLAVVPTATIARFLRESVARVAAADFVHALRGLGVDEGRIRRRVLRNALSPLWTLLGLMLPSLLIGTVVVEQVFSIQGFGRLTLEAVLRRDVATTLAATLVAATLVLLGLLGSDLAQRAADPRVELSR